MIAYVAAPGETVRVTGSEPWAARFLPSSGWSLRHSPESLTIWMADLPAHLFVGYNPFLARNIPEEFWSYQHDWSEQEVRQLLLRRGAVYLDGQPLRQVFRFAELAHTDGAFWVEEPGLRIHFRLPGDADPQSVELEISVREQVFAPLQRHLGWIRLSGFVFEHGADGIPVPQRALVSTTRGHHWIIEDCTIRHANACGLDVGAQDWKASDKGLSGSHVIRRNHITDCGICGIAGATGVNHTLVEDNLIERVGGLNVERIWECAGLKFHVCEGVLIRRNVFRHLRHACGLWLDCANRNCRVSGNVFADIESRIGAVYLECNHEANLLDSNLIWDIRALPEAPDQGGIGCKADANDNLTVAHNLFGKIQGHAVSINLEQAARLIRGRAGLCRRNKVLNNVFVQCPKRILLGRAADNVSDGNLFEAGRDFGSFCIRFPEPAATLNLAAWREYYSLDTRSTEARIEADFNPDDLTLSLKVEGGLPTCVPVEPIASESPVPAAPGPLTPSHWEQASSAEASVRFPVR